MAGPIARIIALGASNLTRGFPHLVALARNAWGSEVQVVAALGHGRSYGAPSRVLMRTLPGILQSGLWPMLARFPHAPTRALVMDVGNDILYGCSAEQIQAWVKEALNRITRVTRDITVIGLPLDHIRRLSLTKYLLLRLVLFPGCRLPLAQVQETAEAVNDGLELLTRAGGLHWCRPDPAWYGWDPIHIRRSCRRSAWETMLGVPDAGGPDCRSPVRERLQLMVMAPERRWMLGIEQFTPQPGIALRRGGQVWLF